MKVAVVGAGIMGLCTARSLCKRGHSVTLIDQHDIGHKLGSSHGRSRIVRSDYPDDFYSEIMIEGMKHWHELDEEFGEILHTSGLLYFGDRDSTNIGSMIQGADSLDIDYELLTPKRQREVFPSLHLAESEIAYFNPASGWVNAERIQKVIYSWLSESGVEFQRLKYEIDSDFTKNFDAVCLLMGGWICTIEPQVKLDTTVQTFGYLKVDPSFQDGPVWIEDREHEVYGFPIESGRKPSAMKFGVHSAGSSAQMDDRFRSPEPEKIAILQDFAQRRFGILESEIEAEACIYTTSPNRDFVWGELQSGTFWASPCSGHGFKFGPWIGERMADLVEGIIGLDAYPRFQHRLDL